MLHCHLGAVELRAHAWAGAGARRPSGLKRLLINGTPGSRCLLNSKRRPRDADDLNCGALDVCFLRHSCHSQRWRTMALQACARCQLQAASPKRADRTAALLTVATGGTLAEIGLSTSKKFDRAAQRRRATCSITPSPPSAARFTAPPNAHNHHAKAVTDATRCLAPMGIASDPMRQTAFAPLHDMSLTRATGLPPWGRLYRGSARNCWRQSSWLASLVRGPRPP